MTANIYIIAGPNGAGKTTFAREFLPRHAHCQNFINADLIAQGLSPFSPALAAFRAGRLMLGEIERLARSGEDFGFETTLSGRTYVPLVHRFKQRGNTVHMFFLWLANPELALQRVRGRVMQGGHDVPAEVVRRRFDRSIRNFFRHYRSLADSWILFDNSGDSPSIIATRTERELHIIQRALYADLKARYGGSE